MNKKKITALETAKKLAAIMQKHLDKFSPEEQNRLIKNGQKVLKNLPLSHD